MLQSLLSLEDDQIATVLDAVQRWCADQHTDIDSGDGRRAIRMAIDLVQTTSDAATLLDTLKVRLAPATVAESKPPLHGHRILIVEDDFLLADEIETALRSLGAEIVGPASNESDALELIALSAVTEAIVDINLGSGVKFDLADQLSGQGIPFPFASGYDQSVVPTRHASVPFYQKPIAIEALVATLRR